MKIKVDLEQPSTWRGFVYAITGISSVLGLIISTDVSLGIIGIGLSIAGAIGFSVPDVNDVKETMQKD